MKIGIVDHIAELTTREGNRPIIVTVDGFSGSGKTRFFIKPNALQMNSSLVITDPNGKVFIR